MPLGVPTSPCSGSSAKCTCCEPFWLLLWVPQECYSEEEEAGDEASLTQASLFP